MTSDAALDPTGEPKPLQPPSTAGMTTKVVKGSMWTLAGQIAPFAVTFISTPFVIRFLGSEGYGVLLLVGLIPMYFSFADFGMGIASTKFSSEAYALGDQNRESEIVWTSVAIAAISACAVAIPIFIFSTAIVSAMSVPDHLVGQASVALKISSAAFVLSIIGSVMNSPLLARLRMDLNTVTQAGPKILLAAVTPIVIYFGGGIVGAVGWAFIVAVMTLVVILAFSGRLLPELFRSGVNREHIRPLLKFGGGWIVGMVAVALIVNLDKLALVRMVSVTSLAYYSVAFTFASTATLFGSAMVQSMVPAFSQLTTPEKKEQFDALFERAIRLNLIWIFPAVIFLFVIARPFFTLWAGPEFGKESTVPFYFLLAGLVFTMPAYVPFAAIAAHGRTDASAKLYWIELVVYFIAVLVLIKFFGIIGAAVAWSFRALVDTFGLLLIARRLANVHFSLDRPLRVLVLGVTALVPTIAFTALYGDWIVANAVVAGGCIAAYSVVAWLFLIERAEREWIVNRSSALLRKIGIQTAS